MTTTPDDSPDESLLNSPDAGLGGALLGLFALIVVVALGIGFAWFIGRTRGAW